MSNHCTEKCGCKCTRCVQYHDHAVQNVCNQECKKCLNVGTVWDPMPHHEPINTHLRYYHGPGYDAEGHFVESFGMGDIDQSKMIKGLLVALAVMAVVYYLKPLTPRQTLFMYGIAAFIASFGWDHVNN